MMTNLERLAAERERIEARLAAVDNQMATLAAMPQDDFDDGNVVCFEKSFGGSYFYSYAAIKWDGLWYTTGPRSPKAYTWDRLVEWMQSGGGFRDFCFVTETEDLV
jgi:hypothetical protein